MPLSMAMMILSRTPFTPVLDNESSTMDNDNSFPINDDSAIDIVDSDSYVNDDWPKMADGSVFDDTELSALVRRGNRPF